MSIVYKLLNADIIDPDYTTAMVYEFQPDLQYVETARHENHKTYLTDEIYRVGIQSFNPIYNLGGIYVMLAFLGAQVFILGAIWVYVKSRKLFTLPG